MANKTKLQAHPWHGISLGEQAPEIVNIYLEIVPTDTVKYEIDKISGHLKVDRPQKFSNFCPMPYGFIPSTYCGEEVAAFAMEKATRTNIIGDGDPLDICILTERTINHGGILVKARPIGGLRMFDNSEADDKIVAVLLEDPAFGNFNDIWQVPTPLIDRLRHYFLTYKDLPDTYQEKKRRCEITHVYDGAEAREIIRRAARDYQNKFPDEE
jgi:inorganic pyrophosphatase